MSRVSVPHPSKPTNPIPSIPHKGHSDGILFSFASLERNEYFNLDGTCQNWASDLFNTMQLASQIDVRDVYAGRYSGKHSTLRIHTHEKAKPPCPVPDNIPLDEFWQIRISKSKGGIHGTFVENIFYVIWFDPQHNLYPDENHGGLKKITPPSTCCKERDLEIEELHKKLKKSEEHCQLWKEYAEGLENEIK